MKVSRFLIACSSALILCTAGACSDNASDSTSDAGSSADLFTRLAGKYGVGVTPRFASCAGESYFPQEMWVVSAFYTTVTAMTIPDTSAGPLALTPTVEVPDSGAASEPAPAASSTAPAASASQTIPPTFRADMSGTLQWKASNEDESTTAGGCLARRSTVLELQFTADGNVTGARSIFNDYTGGADCTASCRIRFDVQGAKLATK